MGKAHDGDRQRRLDAIAFFLEVLVSAAHQARPGEFPEHAAMPWLVLALFGVAIICGLWFAVPESWNAVRRKRPSLTLLMTIVSRSPPLRHVKIDPGPSRTHRSFPHT